MTMFDKQETFEILHLVRDGSYNLERDPHVVINELYNALKYMSTKNQSLIETEDELT